MEKNKSIDLMERMGMINNVPIDETSRRQKAIQSIQGKNRRVKTIVILSAQNPMGKEATKSFNQEKHNDLLKTLKIGHYQYFETNGLYDTSEKSVMIYNISLNDAKQLCYKYNQESIIFIDMMNDNEIIYQYWDHKEKNDELVLSKEKKEIVDANSDDNFYTKISRHFKFRIPFFEGYESILTILKENSIRMNVDECINDTISNEFSGKSKYYKRGKLYYNNGEK